MMIPTAPICELCAVGAARHGRQIQPHHVGMAHNVIVIRYVIYIHNAYTRYTYVRVYQI